MDYALFLRRAFQAIDFVDVRSDILPSQPGFAGMTGERNP